MCPVMTSMCAGDIALTGDLVRSLILPARIRTNLQNLTVKPHVAGV